MEGLLKAGRPRDDMFGMGFIDQPGRKPIDIALTLDVELNRPSISKRTGSLYSGLVELPAVLDVFQAHRVPGTWMIAHDMDRENQSAKIFPRLVERMATLGEIGCYFHFHQQRVARTDEAFQRAGIGQATRYLRSLGHAVTSFRGGDSYLDETSLRVLADLGYTADSSVVPGLHEVSAEGLIADHRTRRHSDPYFPLAGSGLLEIPLGTDTLVDLRTRLVSLLINRVVGIDNLVLADPDVAASRIEVIAQRAPSDRPVVVLSARADDFLEDTEGKLAHLDRFLSLMKTRPGAEFVTLSGVRARFRPQHAPSPPARSLINVTTSDFVRARNGMRRALTALRQ